MVDDLGDDAEMVEPQEMSRVNPGRVRNLPDDLLPLCRQPGWTTDSCGNPTHIAYKAFGFRTPVPKYDGAKYPLRVSWGLWDGKWRLLEDEVRWDNLENAHDVIPGGPADILITIFRGKTRKQVCVDDVRSCLFKKPRTNPSNVLMAQSDRKAQRALDKEIPYHQIPAEERAAYAQAEKKEWDSWLQCQAVEVLSKAETQKVLETKRERVLKSRFCLP